jgi:hypothetical protein
MIIYYCKNIEYFGEGGKVHRIVTCLFLLPMDTLLVISDGAIVCEALGKINVGSYNLYK